MVFCYSQEPLVKISKSGVFITDLCHNVAMHWFFDSFVFFCIVLNTFCLAYTFYAEPAELVDILKIFGLVFNVIYTLEAVIKIIGFKKNYFMDGWNNFDFVIVIAGWMGVVADALALNIGAFTTVIRSFRIMRVFKIIRKYKNLRILFSTFIGAIPKLTNVLLLLFLFLFLYAVLGVFLFAKVKAQENLNVHANFQNFGMALMTLFRMSTGESWHTLMYDCSRQ